jgi:hypothetical protein
MSDAAETPRYVVADHWGHIFDDRSGEVMTRFAYDRAEGRMVHVQYQRDHAWHDGDAATVADVEDSLKNANPDAIVNPQDWDLEATDELPDWAPEPASPAP